jgi:hypothetical protein
MLRALSSWPCACGRRGAYAGGKSRLLTQTQLDLGTQQAIGSLTISFR